MIRTKGVLLSLLVFAVNLSIVATTSVPKVHSDSLSAKVDDLFAEWDRADSSGAAVVVIRNGSIVYKQGYGYATLEYNIPITPSTVFHVASVSKQFTAFALLAQEKKLLYVVEVMWTFDVKN